MNQPWPLRWPSHCKHAYQCVWGRLYSTKLFSTSPIFLFIFEDLLQVCQLLSRPQAEKHKNMCRSMHREGICEKDKEIKSMLRWSPSCCYSLSDSSWHFVWIQQIQSHTGSLWCFLRPTTALYTERAVQNVWSLGPPARVNILRWVFISLITL